MTAPTAFSSDCVQTLTLSDDILRERLGNLAFSDFRPGTTITGFIDGLCAMYLPIGLSIMITKELNYHDKRPRIFFAFLRLVAKEPRVEGTL